ncbi:MAG: oligosaccharide flippase family protein [Bacteroidota bacterium]
MKFKTIIQNIGANLLITTLGLIGSIILARWLGPIQRGVFAAVILIPTILQYFVNFGLSSTTIYFTAQPNSDKVKIWSNLFIIGIFQSITGICFGWYITDFYLQKYPIHSIQLGHLYLVTIPLGLIGMYATYMLQGASYFRIINFLKCIVPMGYCIGIIGLKIQDILSIQNLIFLQLFIQSCYLLTALFLLYKYIIPHFRFTYDFTFIRQMLTYSIKVWFGDISQLANSRIDQFLIGAFLSSRDLGIYTVAVSVAGFMGVFANAVRTVILPMVANKITLSEKINETILFFNRYWLISILLHISFGCSVFLLIPIIFGEQYADSVLVCQILIVGSLFINAKTVLGGGIQGMGFPEIISIVEALGMVISLVFSILLLKTNGLIGVSIAISLAYLGQFLGLIVFTHKKGITYKSLLFTSQSELINYYKWLRKATLK